jgi:hypothetical protein
VIILKFTVVLLGNPLMILYGAYALFSKDNPVAWPTEAFPYFLV